MSGHEEPYDFVLRPMQSEDEARFAEYYAAYGTETWSSGMAYSKGPAITLKGSASHVPGNLAVYGGLERESSMSYAVASRSTLLVAHNSSGVWTPTQISYDEMGDRDPACYVTQVCKIMRKAGHEMKGQCLSECII